MTRQPSGGRRRLRSLDLPSARECLTGVAGAEEDREERDGVSEESPRRYRPSAR